MLLVGKIKGYEIGKNRDGVTNVRLLQVEISDPSDIQTVELFNDDGVDSLPPLNSFVVIQKAGNAWKLATAVNDNIAPDSTLLHGEKKIYSSDAGIIKGFITFLKTGILRINGKNDYAVRYNELDTAMQSLISKINLALAAKLDGVGSSGTVVQDFTDAKVTTVLMPDKTGA